MSAKVQGLVFVRVVGFLEYGHIIHAARMQVGVFLYVERIDFDADHTEILARALAVSRRW